MMVTVNDYLESFVTKVDFHGKKRKKLSCPPGYKVNSEGTACVPMDSTEKHNLKIGSRDATRTKKQGGAALKKITAKHTAKAMNFRKKFGLSEADEPDVEDGKGV